MNSKFLWPIPIEVITTDITKHLLLLFIVNMNPPESEQ